MVLPLVLTAVSCSEDVLPDKPTGGTDTSVAHEVEVTLNFENGASLGIGGRSRAMSRGVFDYKNLCLDLSCEYYKQGNGTDYEPPREMDCSNNWQQVNDVRIYVFQKTKDGDKFLYYRPEDSNGDRQDYYDVAAFRDKFAFSEKAIWYGGAGKEKVDEQYAYTIKPRLQPECSYKFIAIARDDRNIASNKKLMTDPNVYDKLQPSWEEGKTSLDDAAIKIMVRGTGVRANELFFGESDAFYVSEKTMGISGNITLNRRVAGLIAYVENVPAEMEVMQTIDLEDVEINKGEKKPVNLMAILSGKMTDGVLLRETEKLYSATHVDASASTFILGRRFAVSRKLGINDSKENGYYVNTWPANTGHPNSVLFGSFIMPQPKKDIVVGGDADYNTIDKSLYLVFFTDETTSEGSVLTLPIAWIPIKMQGKQTDREKYYYSIDANSIYSLGKRKYSPDGKELKEDEPIDLRKAAGESIEITVHIDWFDTIELEWGK